MPKAGRKGGGKGRREGSRGRNGGKEGLTRRRLEGEEVVAL